MTMDTKYNENDLCYCAYVYSILCQISNSQNNVLAIEEVWQNLQGKFYGYLPKYNENDLC